jgi:hypothetical protein
MKDVKNNVNLAILEIDYILELLTQTAEVPFRKVGDECVTKRFIYSKNNYEM